VLFVAGANPAPVEQIATRRPRAPRPGNVRTVADKPAPND